MFDYHYFYQGLFECEPRPCAQCGKLVCYQFDEEECPDGHGDVWELSAGDPRVVCSEKCTFLVEGWNGDLD